jgi:hypothetical protein
MRYTGAPERTVIAYEDVSGNPIDVSPTTALPVTGGGGGGGSSLSDTVFVDSTGQLFVYRDTGTGTPSAYTIPAWTLYTPVGAVTTPQRDATESTESLLVRMLNYLNSPMGYDKSLQRQRGTVLVESGTVTTVTTVTNLTNINGNIGTYQATQQVYGQNLTAWAAVVRARIT